MKNKILLIGGKYTAKLVIEIFGPKFEYIVYDTKLENKFFNGNYSFMNDLKKINFKDLDKYFVCIGDNHTRKNFSNMFDELNLKTINIISSDSRIDKLKRIGTGNLIYGNVYFDYFTKIGNYNYINCSSSILHDSLVGDFNFISPNVTINGNCSLGNNIFIGSSAVIGPEVTICDDVIIGANSFVKNSIMQKGLYVGSPAKLKV